VGADGVGVGFFADEIQAEPVILAGGIVAEEDGWAVVYGYEDIDGAVVIEIAESEAAGAELAGEGRPTVCADIFQAGGRVLEKKERLAVGYAGIDFVD